MKNWILPLVILLAGFSLSVQQKKNERLVQTEDFPAEFGQENTSLILVYGDIKAYDKDLLKFGNKLYHGSKVFCKDYEVKKYPIASHRFALDLYVDRIFKADGTSYNLYYVSLKDRKTGMNYENKKMVQHSKSLPYFLTKLEEMRVKGNVIPTVNEE